MLSQHCVDLLSGLQSVSNVFNNHDIIKYLSHSGHALYLTNIHFEQLTKLIGRRVQNHNSIGCVCGTVTTSGFGTNCATPTAPDKKSSMVAPTRLEFALGTVGMVESMIKVLRYRTS